MKCTCPGYHGHSLLYEARRSFALYEPATGSQASTESLRLRFGTGRATTRERCPRQLRAPRRKEEERLSSQKLNRQIEHGEYAFQRFGLVCDPLARLLTYALQMNLGWSPRTCLYYNSGIINNRDLRMVRSIYTILAPLSKA